MSKEKKGKENPDGSKKKYPGPTEESLPCSPIGSLSCTPGGDATGSSTETNIKTRHKNKT